MDFHDFSRIRVQHRTTYIAVITIHGNGIHTPTLLDNDNSPVAVGIQTEGASSLGT